MVRSSLFFGLLPRNSQYLLGSALTVATFLISLCIVFEPRWETNDDIAMSMVAHGYGVATVGSPNILFSNVLWGHLVRAIPEINGVLGYSIATLSVLFIVGVLVVYGLFRLGLGYIACLSVLLLIFVRPVLFPQFTINAGLLMVAAIICWNLYEKRNDVLVLVAGCILAFLSYLVRSHEFLLVFMLALPLLPWRLLFCSRSVRIAFIILFSAIAISAVIDKQAYQGEEWSTFNELNPARAPFTDYNAGYYLKEKPNILTQHGYSINDIDLVTSWFFVDPNLANPQSLQNMLAELGPLPLQGGSLSNALASLKTLAHPVLLAPGVAALLLALLLPSWRVAVSWILCITAVFVLGLLGRPGILRVYVPLISLLLIAPFLCVKLTAWKKRISAIILLFAALINITYVFSESKNSYISDKYIRTDLAHFPHSPVVIWAATFPYEAIYPVLRESSSERSFKHYGMGTSTWAPFSVAYSEQKLGRGMLDLLITEAGMPIMAQEPYIKMLEIYCVERLGGKLEMLSLQKYGTFEVSQRKCEVNP